MIFDQKEQKCWNKTFKWSKCIYWVFKYYELRLWEDWWIQPKQTKKAIIKELFLRCRKLNILLVFITQACFSVPKDVRWSSTHYLIMKINKKSESENIVRSHLADTDYEDFVKLYKECVKEHFSCLTIDTTLPASDPLSIRKIL